MDEEKKVIVDEKTEKERSKLYKFMKKHGFYIGVFCIFILVIVVMTSDLGNSYSGTIKYDEKAFYSENNKLYLKENDKDAVLLTANVLKEFTNTKIGKVILMCKISEDQKYIYFFEDVIISGENYIGTLCLYKNNKKIVISENVALSYALSNDLNKVAYVKGSRTSDDQPFTYDLYFYENGNEILIETDVDKECYTLSGDAKTIIYNKGFYPETRTTSMYIYKNGESTLIDNQVVQFYKLNANGTYKSNWPYTNTDGSKILFATYGGEESLPTLKLYKTSDKSITTIANNFVQVFVDENLDRAIINGETRSPAFVGEYIKYDLNKMTKEVYATDIWALMHLDIAKHVDDSYFDMNFYMKRFDPNTDTADLYFKGEGKEEEKVLTSIFVDDIKINNTYTQLFALEYYYSAEGGTLVQIDNISKNSFEVNEISEKVMEYHLDDKFEVLGYRKDIKLYLIDKTGDQKMIDNRDVDSFEITGDGNLLYFYKTKFDGGQQIGKGELYGYDINKGEDYTLLDKEATFIYEYGNQYVAYISEFSFASESGKLIITDGNDNFEIIAQNASTLLLKNYIK